MHKIFSWTKKTGEKGQMDKTHQSYPTQQPYQPQQQQHAQYSYQQPSAPQQYQLDPSGGGLPPQPYDMSGMPPPPPSYQESLYHPVAGQNYQGPQQQQYYPVASQNYQAPHQQYYPTGPAFQNYGHVNPVPPAAQAKTVNPPVAPTQYLPEAFNAGARFGSGSEVRIPPPPPGVAPNAAQFAQAMGQNVVLGQKRSKFL